MDKAVLASLYGTNWTGRANENFFVILCESDNPDIGYAVHIVREWGVRVIWVHTLIECTNEDEAYRTFNSVR